MRFIGGWQLTDKENEAVPNDDAEEVTAEEALTTERAPAEAARNPAPFPGALDRTAAAPA